MSLRHLSSRTSPSCPYLVSSTCRPTCTIQSRHLATSAQKRKWQRQKGNKPFLKKKYAEVAAEEVVSTKPKSTNTSWQPLFFLGVFPVFLSVAVVLARDDLREEVNAKGIGRFLEDYKTWRIKSQLELQQQQLEQQGQLGGEEQESEYDKMLNHLAQQKPRAN
mmetsp:Transcript_8340/g.17291  ORF Transcript_8340/g.17291 Transcript_8340/m.17291 type:complete len:163 (-) Transcript_8340:1314-1802(-)